MDLNLDTVSLIANFLLFPAVVSLTAYCLKNAPKLVNAAVKIEELEKKSKNVTMILATIASIVENIEVAEADNVIDPVEAVKIITQIKDLVSSPEVKDLIKEFTT
jgi:hypothetical protein